MAIGEQLPFPVGSTAFGSGLFTPTATELTSLEGREYTVEDVNPTTKVRRSNKRRKLRVVRNTSGVNLLPKMLVRMELSSDFGGQVDGYARIGSSITVGAEKCFPVDEYLPAAGVANNDLFYIVVEGPAIALTGATAATATGEFVPGTRVVAQTAAASTHSTTAGRLASLTTVSTFGPYDCLGVVGVALSTRTSANTNTDILIEVGRW